MNYLDVRDFEGENVGLEFRQTWGLDQGQVI